METVAGFVPCAESGMTTRLRASPFATWYARNTMSAVSSPCAPAAGCSVTRGRPETAASAYDRPTMSSSAPCVVDTGWYGCSPAKPSSFNLGLYFMVQLPKGYGPLSTPKFIDARCV
jgi:hypothetical protein